MAGAAPYFFNVNELWTLWIAAYAAIISTFVHGWDAYKWLASGSKIEISASTGMKVIGGLAPDQNTYITVTARNIGDQPTTITNLGGLYFDSWWCAYIWRKKPKQAFIICEPSKTQPIPYRFEVGAQWNGRAIQSDDLVKMAKEGYLFMILYTVSRGGSHRVRVKLRKNETEES